jgi:hypothetical protein
LMVTRFAAAKRLSEASSKIKRVWLSVQPLSAPENAKLLKMTTDLDRYARKLKTMGRR